MCPVKCVHFIQRRFTIQNITSRQLLKPQTHHTHPRKKANYMDKDKKLDHRELVGHL